MAKISTVSPAIAGTVRRKYLAAVAARNDRFDGAFVYAVRSTGIYCQPSCPSRRPHTKQVLLFAAPEAAERAGFRACRRCHPGPARGKSLTNPQSQMIRKVCKQIEESVGQSAGLPGLPDLRRLAGVAGLSPAHLQRTFRRAMGISPRQFADAVRVARLKSGLRKEIDVTTALYQAGYGSSSRLYEQSNAQLGMTPAAYRRGGRGMSITYTIADSRMGRVLVAATERGISAVFLGNDAGNDDARLAACLRREYPHAEIRRGAAEHSKWVRAIVRHLAGSNPGLDLPTDVVATAFQRRVWEALRSIPFGATRTYSEVARTLGRPSATRAVARACATNPAAIVVPCHRVVRKDGSLGGYRWGLQRKEQLLDQERRIAKREGISKKSRKASAPK